MKLAYQTQTKHYNDQSHLGVCRARFSNKQNKHFN